jgi:hypothetical protein
MFLENSSQRRGRFLVQEIEDKNSVDLMKKKSRHYSIDTKLIHETNVSDNISENNSNNGSTLSKVMNVMSDKWENVNTIWNSISDRLYDETDDMDIMFNYDLINKKSDPEENENILEEEGSIIDSDSNAEYLLYFTSESKEDEDN